MTTLVALAIAGGVCVAYNHADATGLRPASPQVRAAEDVYAGLAPNSTSDAFELGTVSRREQLMGECMSARGLTYRPKDPRGLVDVVTNSDFTSLDYARRYGFGVTAFPRFATTPDPNARYVDALPAPARNAYEVQLESCVDAAADQDARTPVLAEARQRAARGQTRVLSDSRYRAAERAWVRCSTAAGHPAASRPDLIAGLRTDREHVLARLTASAPSGSAGSMPDVEERAAQDRAYQALRAVEIRAAVDTFPCSVDLDRVFAERYQAQR